MVWLVWRGNCSHPQISIVASGAVRAGIRWGKVKMKQEWLERTAEHDCVSGGTSRPPSGDRVRPACAAATPGMRMNRRKYFTTKYLSWFALLAVVTAIVGSSAPVRAESAESDFKRGESAEAREDYDAAFDFYQKALTKKPKDLAYKTA